MSSTKRRAARRIRLVMRAYEQSWRKPESDALWVAFEARKARFDARFIWGKLRSRGVDLWEIMRRDGLVFRREP